MTHISTCDPVKNRPPQNFPKNPPKNTVGDFTETPFHPSCNRRIFQQANGKSSSCRNFWNLMWHLSNQGSGGGMSIDDLEEGLVWRCFLVGRGDGGKSACCWGYPWGASPFKMYLVNVGEYQELVYNSLQKTTEQRVSQLCCETSK